MALKDVITLGIGASPGSVKYFLTFGLWPLSVRAGPLQGSLSELAKCEGALGEVAGCEGALGEVVGYAGVLSEVIA